MDKYIVAPPNGSTNNGIGASDRKWKEGHFEKLPGINEYLAESTGYGIVSGCEPTISGLTVTVGAGVVHLADGTRKEIAQTNITLDNADSTNPRIDLVYITSTGAVAKITGTAAVSPSAPSVPTGGVSVCNVTVAAGATTGTLIDVSYHKNYDNVKYESIFEDATPSTRFSSFYKAMLDYNERKALDEEEETLTVATFNVLTENSVRKSLKTSTMIAARVQTVALMTKAQVIGFNEATTNMAYPFNKLYNPGIYTDYLFNANVINIGASSGFYGLYTRGTDYGNALLSAFALSNKTSASYIPVGSEEKRGYAHAEVTVGSKTISIYSTHFGLSDETIADEISQLMTIISSDLALYKIVMGDFNFNTSTSELIQPFLQNNFKRVNNGQYNTFNKTSPIDEIMVTNNIEVLESGYIEVTDVSSRIVGNSNKAVSDHSPLYARLKFN